MNKKAMNLNKINMASTEFGGRLEYVFTAYSSKGAVNTFRVDVNLGYGSSSATETAYTDGGGRRYAYSASGQKLRVTHYVAKPNVTRAFGVRPVGSTQDEVLFASQTDYLLGGSLVVRDGSIDKALFDGGYAKATRLGSTTYGFSPYYYNKDHLGNIREVVNMGGTVQQVTNYYPFGAPYADPNAVMGATVQSYKYNGKELDRMHGLDTYDYGARQYDPILARWDRVDPLCEKYYGVSPYVYCGDDPLNAIDPDGKKSYLILWASDANRYGHAAFAIDNYKYDSQNKIMVPDGTLTCYGLFPIAKYSVNQAIKDEKARGHFYVSRKVSLEDIRYNNFESGEKYKPDGIIEINSDYNHDTEAKKKMESEMQSNKGYRGRSRNCSTFAREGVKIATGNDVSGEEGSLLIFNYVTPNRLFQDTKKLENTKVLKDPEGKEENSFVSF